MDKGRVSANPARKIGTERLAGVGGIDHQGRAREVLQLVVFRVEPRGDAILIFGEIPVTGLTGNPRSLDMMISVAIGKRRQHSYCFPVRLKGALTSFQVGLLTAMSMSRAKIGKPL